MSQPIIAVVERGRTAEFVPTIIVNDRPHIAPSAGLSSAVITLGAAPLTLRCATYGFSRVESDQSPGAGRPNNMRSCPRRLVGNLQL